MWATGAVSTRTPDRTGRSARSAPVCRWLSTAFVCGSATARTRTPSRASPTGRQLTTTTVPGGCRQAATVHRADQCRRPSTTADPSRSAVGLGGCRRGRRAARPLVPDRGPARNPSRPGGAAAGADLLRRWAEPHRRYHDLRHLAEVLAALDLLAAEGPAGASGRPGPAAYRGTSGGPACGVLARRGVRPDGPATTRSAAPRWRRPALTGLGLEPGLVAEVARLVLLTAGHEATRATRRRRALRRRPGRAGVRPSATRSTPQPCGASTPTSRRRVRRGPHRRAAALAGPTAALRRPAATGVGGPGPGQPGGRAGPAQGARASCAAAPPPPAG